MTILGIDPGTATVGWAVITKEKARISLVACDEITTPKTDNPALRLKTIHDRISELLSTHQPHVAAIEQLYFQTNVKTAIRVAEARGVILLACAEKDIPVISYSPLTIKQTITGDGRADKRQIQFMLEKTLNIKAPKPDDIADAVAIALTHAYTNRF